MVLLFGFVLGIGPIEPENNIHLSNRWPNTVSMLFLLCCTMTVPVTVCLRTQCLSPRCTENNHETVWVSSLAKLKIAIFWQIWGLCEMQPNLEKYRTVR